VKTGYVYIKRGKVVVNENKEPIESDDAGFDKWQDDCILIKNAYVKGKRRNIHPSSKKFLKVFVMFEFDDEEITIGQKVDLDGSTIIKIYEEKQLGMDSMAKSS